MSNIPLDLKKVRAAVGRQICRRHRPRAPSQPQQTATASDPPKSQRKTRRISGGLEVCTGGVSAGPKPGRCERGSTREIHHAKLITTIALLALIDTSMALAQTAGSPRNPSVPPPSTNPDKQLLPEARSATANRGPISVLGEKPDG